ncbi:MAG: PEP-CTERM sorting domain-containing protein [Gemmataceae bacterium]|nr:PEP-CTERM sorting domain-containing protein [Gemmataceae bacterium]
MRNYLMGSSPWRRAMVTLVVVICSILLGGTVHAFGGRPTPIEPSAPIAPDTVPETDKPVEDAVVDPIEEPTDLPIFGIELPPEDIWSEPDLIDWEIVTTGAPAEPHQLRDVPEPGTVGLAGLGLAILAVSRRWRRTNRS